MDFMLPVLRLEEKTALHLRALYEERGYQKYRMSSFEEYDLYLQNKPFLMGEDVIAFTSADGRLMALKPDVTLSIVKSTPNNLARRVYYTENVFRRSRQTGEYREISQTGLEHIGGNAEEAEAEVLLLAAESLGAIGEYSLDISHMGIVEAVLEPFEHENFRSRAFEALKNKSPHIIKDVSAEAGIDSRTAECLAKLTGLSGPFERVMPAAKELAGNFFRAANALNELESLYAILKSNGFGAKIRLDFSILNDADYYNGIIFQGYIKGIPNAILTGGRYDNLMRRFEKSQGAVGFALSLDKLSRAAAGKEVLRETDCWLNVALPKGRLGNKVYRLFEKAGFSCNEEFEESRKLIFEDARGKVRFFLVKPTDVDIYVEHGAADIGVAGRDSLLESGADVLELMDLGFGKCRLAVAGRAGFREDLAGTLRVATKYPNVARRYYGAKSRPVKIIKLHGSIELAPLLDLADVVVDIVETGVTLKENDLEVLAEVEPSSARLIANKAAWRFKGERIQDLAERFGALL